jgi:hypothetical protein
MKPMSREKLDQFASGETRFIGEQVGISENEFKGSVVNLLHGWSRPLRAYLAQVEYGGKRDFNVALCVASEAGEDENIANNIALIFRRMFGPREHLDIMFLSENQETQLRKVCCPFFSSSRVDCPDFYLASGEGYALEEVRACYKEKRLMNGHPDGYMLCEIDPPIVGQSYGLGGQDIERIIIASRHAGYSLFAIKGWPAYVHVARLIHNIPDDKFAIAENHIESIGWAEVYESSTAAKASLT